MRWTDAVAIALQWPQVSESLSYGEPSLKVRKHLLARHRVQDDSLVLLDVPFEERAHLVALRPDVFFCEPHYESYQIVLARLSLAPAESVTRILQRRWRGRASQRALAASAAPPP